MPKVTLTEQARVDEKLLRYIRRQRGDLDLTQREVAQKIGLHEDTFSRRLKDPDTFTRRELRCLFKVLHFTEEEIREVAL